MAYKDPDYRKKYRARNKEKTKAYNKADHARRSEDPAYREAARVRSAEHYRNRDPVERKQKRAQNYAENREEILAAQKAAYDPVKQRNATLMRLYGLTPLQYDALWVAQGNVCYLQNRGA